MQPRFSFPTARRFASASALLWGGLIYLIFGANPSARASCNQIPGATNLFRSTLGTVTRPFAGPDDFVEIQLDEKCDVRSRGFRPNAYENVVTLVFHPPGAAAIAAVLASNCDSLATRMEQCRTRTDLSGINCIDADAGTSAALALIESGARPALRFRFPDTDEFAAPRNDDRTLSGAITIAVSGSDQPLPCMLASQDCRATEGLFACIDRFFEWNGTCDSTPNRIFPGFTALPPPNDYQALCTEPSPPCTGRASELRFTLDAQGNVLLPMDWSGVLLGDHVPIARLLRGGTAIEAFPDSGLPIEVPGRGFLRSFSPEGGTLPPLFEPQSDPTSNGELTLFGSVDAPNTVLRVSRRSPVFRECRGGAAAEHPCIAAGECPDGSCVPAHCRGGGNDGRECGGDRECPNGECGPSLFDLTGMFSEESGTRIIPRFAAGVCETDGHSCVSDSTCNGGRCLAFRLNAEDPVPLEGLVSGDQILLSVIPEAIAGRDLNGDADQTDYVSVIRDRRTGRTRPIPGSPGQGTAVTQIHQRPFVFSGVAVEGDIVALLAAEPLEGATDINGDGDRFDSILRIYDLSGSSIRDVTTGAVETVDAAPLVEGRSVFISDGMVFFRTAERDGARRRTSRQSVATDGLQSNGPSTHAAVSGDGFQIAFESSASNLGGVILGGPGTTYVRNRPAAQTQPLAVSIEDGSPSAALQPSLSEDGRFIAVTANDAAGVPQVVVVDRDSDADGIFDEAGTVTDVAMSRSPLPPFALGEAPSMFPSISADGRFVGFVSHSHSLFAERPNASTHARVWLHDRDSDESGTFDQRTSIAELSHNTDSVVAQRPAISASGRQLAFATFAREPLPDDTNDFCLNVNTASNSCADVLTFDFETNGYDRASASSGGVQANNQSLTPALSADGRWLAFESAANNLVAGDTNGAVDVFVRDRLTQSTFRVTRSSDGEQANAGSFDRAIGISADGRWITFSSPASNLVPGNENGTCGTSAGFGNCRDIFLHDQLTGFTERVSVAVDQGNAAGPSRRPAISQNGSVIAFESSAANLIADDTNDFCDNDRDGNADDNCTDIFASEPDESDVVADRSGDGDIDDVVLQVLDTRNPSARVRVLGQAGAVSISSRRALFLTDETETPGGVDLNGDGDTRDQVVRLFDGTNEGDAQNLRRAGVAVALSDSRVAALVSEFAQGDTDLNGDGDTSDTVVETAAIAEPTSWISVRQAAEAIEVSGDWVIFLTPEAAQGTDLNNDGDRIDRVLQVYDAQNGTLTNLERAAEEFVVDGVLVAFRTPESAQANTDLNGDGDAADAVMHLYDLASRQLFSTEQAATLCNLDACDPRLPYRVSEHTVRFLTLEEEQRGDLNSDGDSSDLILQTFNIRLAQARLALEGGGAEHRRDTTTRVYAATGNALSVDGAVQTGICNTTGLGCAKESDCEGGRCYLPPGHCVRNSDTICNPQDTENRCGKDAFCVTTGNPGVGSCRRVEGACQHNGDCANGAICEGSDAASIRLVNPLAQNAEASSVFIGAGTCVELLDEFCSPDKPCSSGQSCRTRGSGEARCERRRRTCRSTADCPASAQCEFSLLVASAADSDSDEVVDPFDNCPAQFNPDQLDSNGNGVGNACDLGGDAPPPTGTPTRPLSASPTPPADHDERDGCQIGALSPRAAISPWLALAAALVLRIKRRLRHVD